MGNIDVIVKFQITFSVI